MRKIDCIRSRERNYRLHQRMFRQRKLARIIHGVRRIAWRAYNSVSPDYFVPRMMRHVLVTQPRLSPHLVKRLFAPQPRSNRNQRTAHRR